MESEQQESGDWDGKTTDLVDSHFHVWQLEKFSYPWPTRQQASIFRDFSVEDLEHAVKTTPVKHAIFVQVLNNCPEETEWLSQLAERHDVIKGIVAGIDLTDPQLETTLARLTGEGSRVVGLRHILDMEADDWLTRDDVIAGLRVLEARGIPFDLLLRPHLLKYVPQLSAKLPRLRMVVDHLAKPDIRGGRMEQWASDISAIALNPNIYCKLSGMVTEADPHNWKEEHFEPYVKHVLECFGRGRCMFGSDWPVCGMAGASYRDVFQLLQSLIRGLDPTALTAVFRDNALQFYKIRL